MTFTRASDDELRENGWDPEWIVVDPEENGPFAVCREPDAICGSCGGGTLGWTVVNLATATGISETWTHDEGEIEATERAQDLNAAWLSGYASGAAP